MRWDAMFFPLTSLLHSKSPLLFDRKRSLMSADHLFVYFFNFCSNKQHENDRWVQVLKLSFSTGEMKVDPKKRSYVKHSIQSCIIHVNAIVSTIWLADNWEDVIRLLFPWKWSLIRRTDADSWLVTAASFSWSINTLYPNASSLWSEWAVKVEQCVCNTRKVFPPKTDAEFSLWDVATNIWCFEGRIENHPLFLH